MPQWKDFVSWIFFGMLAFYGYSISTNMDKITDSIAQLNINVAVVVEKVSTQGKELEKIDARVIRLEHKEDLK